jgi:hypothetical protein
MAAGIIVRFFGSGILAAALFGAPVLAAEAPALSIGRAYFAQEAASAGARHLADWIVDSNDHRDLPFLIVDKKNAKAFVFDATGRIKGAAPVLLGSAKGDDSVPGIGERKLAAILASERTTPAGRFVANLDRDIHGMEILWIDYDAAISLHRVITSNPGERRAQRLASPTPDDNRISFGCINVPVDFYEHVVSPTFSKQNGIVYVLPETRSLRETFGSYDVSEQDRQSILPSPAQVVGNLPADSTIRLR